MVMDDLNLHAINFINEMYLFLQKDFMINLSLKNWSTLVFFI